MHGGRKHLIGISGEESSSPWKTVEPEEERILRPIFTEFLNIFVKLPEGMVTVTLCERNTNKQMTELWDIAPCSLVGVGPFSEVLTASIIRAMKSTCDNLPVTLSYEHRNERSVSVKGGDL
jgi:hypothetical protein